MKNLSKKHLFLVLGILTLLTIGFLKRHSSIVKGIKNKKRYQVKKQTLKEILALSGKVDAEEKTTLRFQTSGRLSWVGVKEGDYVKKGQPIASLDKRELKKRFKKYLNSYVKERLDFEQTKDDYWNKQFDLEESVRREAKRILEKAQYDLNNSVLDVEIQNLSLKYATIFSPIEGIVTRIEVPYSGVNITPAQAEFEIINPKTLFLSIGAEQSDVVKLKKGMKGKIVFDAFPKKTFFGQIYYISFSPQTDETGTVYQVRVELPPSTEKIGLKLAMTADIDFTVREIKNVLAIPESSVKREKGKTYVYKQTGNKIKKALVSLGELFDDKVVVKSGLQENDIILY